MPRLELLIEGEPAAVGPVDGTHIAGVLRGDDGRDMPFVGWVALLALLERVLRTPRADALAERDAG